jgi:LysM repeat protein
MGFSVFSGIIGVTMQRISIIFVLLGMALSLGMNTNPSITQASSGYDMVAAVNDFRATNGLPALQTDPILMSIAQAHSEYQASVGTVTHTGPGGSSLKDRAYTAGFGGGATIFLSENIAGGPNLSIQTAIYQYWQDATHLSTMLNPAAIYIGAGVAKAGDYVYYTVDAGYYSGAPASVASSDTPGGSTNSGPTAVAYEPFVVVTPLEDGAIIHVVGYGQSLIGIAKTYQVELNDILQLNSLTMDSIIYPGEEIIIRAGSTPTLTTSPTRTLPTTTASLTATRMTPTPRGTFTQNPTASSTPTTTPMPVSTERERLITGVVVMALVIFLAVIVSGLLARKTEISETKG